MADVKVRIGADASEFSRVMKGVRGDIQGVRNVIGGLVGAAATVYGLTKAFQGLGAVLKDSSLEAAGIESLTMQFETLLGSASAAKKRMDEIAKFAANTPFEIKELAATSKLLQNLGGDMLATGDGLRMVGDAAAIAGQPLQEVALHVGRVFNAITSGTSAGESVNRLQEIGLLTGKAKRQFEELAAAQKKGTVPALQAADAMRLLQGQFAKTEGAMERLASTTEGKLSNLADNISQLKVAFGTGMNEGLKVGLDTINAELPKFTEAFSKAGETFGTAIGEAVSGNPDQLAEIGVIAGTLVGKGFIIGLKATAANAFSELTPSLLKFSGLGGLGAAMATEDGAQKGQAAIRRSQFEMAKFDMKSAVRDAGIQFNDLRFRQTDNGYQAPTIETLEADRTAVFLKSMASNLEEIRRNTATKPFPN